MIQKQPLRKKKILCTYNLKAAVANLGRRKSRMIKVFKDFFFRGEGLLFKHFSLIKKKNNYKY